MQSALKNKVVWLIGASSGIGEAFAYEVNQTGCKLVLSARRLEKLQEISSKCSGSVVHALDVSDKDSLKVAYEKIIQEFGVVDVLIANAGIHIPTKVKAFDTEEYARIMEINYFGVLNCIETVLPNMIERKEGHIVAVSSVAAYRGLPRAAAYGASKAAITHFCESMRLDLEPLGIDVTVVSPGFVKTPLTDKNDFEMPFLMEAKEAARCMRKGIEARKFEVHFPWKFTLFLKLLRILPFAWYHRLIRKTVKTDKYNE